MTQFFNVLSPHIEWALPLIAALLVAEHYFPWRLVIGRELPRLAAYVLGVAAILVPFSAALIRAGYLEIAYFLWLSAVVGGSTVGLCYLIDWIVEKIRDGKDAAERERAAMERYGDREE